MSANKKQVGGSHYKLKAIQPWDYIAANGLGFFEGNIVKYATRCRTKGRPKKLRLRDLQKIIHYAEKLIELENG